MTGLIGVIQTVIKNYLDAVKLTDKATGTVVSYITASYIRRSVDPDVQCLRKDKSSAGRERYSDCNGRFKDWG